MRSILLCATLASGACASGPRIVTPSDAACSALLPQEWRQGVEGAELPAGDVVADWIAFGDAQTGRLDQANGRTRDAIGIVERCEARDRAAIERSTRRRVLGIF
jgi:hypothetical protein